MTTPAPNRSGSTAEILTVPEVAEILRLGRSTAYDLIASGALPHLRIGGAIRIARSDLEEFLAEARCCPARPAGRVNVDGILSDIRAKSHGDRGLG